MPRALVALVAVAALLASGGTALGHAVLVSSSPAADQRLAAAPEQVTLTFSEPVQIVQSDDVDVVDGQGQDVASGPATNEAQARVVVIPLRPDLPDGTYTVRYTIVSADSHVIPGVVVFGVGVQELGEPYLAGADEGPSETGPWGVSSRFLEMVGLGGLVGLLAFRWLVWGPAVRAGGAGGDRDAVLGWGRDVFWVGFGALAVGAMLAEGYLLVVQSASVLGTGVLEALGDATGISQVLGDTRFGSLVQLRGALLFGLFAIGAIQFIREYGNAGSPRPPSATGSRAGAVLMAALLLAVLGSIAAQGHASVAPMSGLQVAAQLVHTVAVAVWITGLALVALAYRRLPAVAPDGGPALSTRILARFSRVALIAVGVAVLTGVIRSLGELDDPAELWDTAYGRSILFKIGLLIPIAALALYNRRILEALRRVPRPNMPTMRLVRRMAASELALSLAIVVIASLLVAQVPGGT
ncbi:MAG TPA: copper resistance protein CopC [Miltoncostaeaceae bacterium]|nr:copper resistance protein CopC [Miltoncostaeaceae bacterium]